MGTHVDNHITTNIELLGLRGRRNLVGGFYFARFIFAMLRISVCQCSMHVWLRGSAGFGRVKIGCRHVLIGTPLRESKGAYFALPGLGFLYKLCFGKVSSRSS